MATARLASPLLCQSVSLTMQRYDNGRGNWCILVQWHAEIYIFLDYCHTDTFKCHTDLTDLSDIIKCHTEITEITEIGFCWQKRLRQILIMSHRSHRSHRFVSASRDSFYYFWHFSYIPFLASYQRLITVIPKKSVRSLRSV